VVRGDLIDPNQFETVKPYVQTQNMGPYMLSPFKDKELIPGGVMYLSIVKNVLESALANAKLPEADWLNAIG
jgi:hypothetical protein